MSLLTQLKFYSILGQKEKNMPLDLMCGTKTHFIFGSKRKNTPRTHMIDKVARFI